MIPVPYLLLVGLILLNQGATWYYHRVMPPLLRAAMVVPGVALAVVFIVFHFGEQFLPMVFRHAMTQDILFVYFLWNGVFVFITRNQHRKDVQ